MSALARLSQSMIELNDSTNYCAFIRFHGHVNIMEIEIMEGKIRPRYSKKVYSREFHLADREYREAATNADVQRVINLIDYLIVRDQETNDYDPNFDDCVWDSDRIEATKTILFHEYLVRGGSRNVERGNSKTDIRTSGNEMATTNIP